MGEVEGALPGAATRIAYAAKHNSGGNDDEGAIAHALRGLGCDVVCIDQDRLDLVDGVGADFCLLHKPRNLNALRKVQTPKVVWYFDLVEYNDSTLTHRNVDRIGWMRIVRSMVKLIFCTDGDWADRFRCYWLPQGADERYIGRSVQRTPGWPLMCPASKGGGRGRDSFIEHMERAYGRMFHRVTGVHQNDMAALVANSSIVVAPDHPATDRYWSNRVYQMCGFGAFLLHPRCALLSNHYNANELVMYDSRETLEHQIAQYIGDPEYRRVTAESALARTMEEHLYRHRCKELLTVVKHEL